MWHPLEFCDSARPPGMSHCCQIIMELVGVAVLNWIQTRRSSQIAQSISLKQDYSKIHHHLPVAYAEGVPTDLLKLLHCLRSWAEERRECKSIWVHFDLRLLLSNSWFNVTVYLGDCGSSYLYLSVCGYVCLSVPLLRLVSRLLWVRFRWNLVENVGT